MKKITLLLFILFAANSFSQAPAIQWQKNYGGTKDDVAYCVRPTSDGGYVVVGASSSNDNNVSGNHMASATATSVDIWVVKLLSDGTIDWQKSLGGSENDTGYSIEQTTDGGYIVLGSTYSDNGNISDNNGFIDFWAVKLSSSGNIQWENALGGFGSDKAACVKETPDGGYILCGSTFSNNSGDVIGGNVGVTDCWVVKLNSLGTLVWQKRMGGSLGVENLASIYPTSDGGYIAAGYSNSNNWDVSGNHGQEDYWIVKMNNLGGIEWQKCLGGVESDEASSIIQTTDGGYAVVGTTYSTDGQVTNTHGSSDIWVVKLFPSGEIQWQKALGGSFIDIAYSIEQASDGNYIIAGETNSNNGDVSGLHSTTRDFWIAKLSAANGDLRWQRTLGGSEIDQGTSIRQTPDGGYIVAGAAASSNGDLTANLGGFDLWVVKLLPEALATVNFNATTLRIMPNPATSILNIELPDGNTPDKIVISDVTGKIIKPFYDTSVIDIEAFEKGIYILEVFSAAKNYQAKFIKN